MRVPIGSTCRGGGGVGSAGVFGVGRCDTGGTVTCIGIVGVTSASVRFSILINFASRIGVTGCLLVGTNGGSDTFCSGSGCVGGNADAGNGTVPTSVVNGAPVCGANAGSEKGTAIGWPPGGSTRPMSAWVIVCVEAVVGIWGFIRTGTGFCLRPSWACGESSIPTAVEVSVGGLGNLGIGTVVSSREPARCIPDIFWGVSPTSVGSLCFTGLRGSSIARITSSPRGGEAGAGSSASVTPRPWDGLILTGEWGSGVFALNTVIDSGVSARKGVSSLTSASGSTVTA